MPLHAVCKGKYRPCRRDGYRSHDRKEPPRRQKACAEKNRRRRQRHERRARIRYTLCALHRQQIARKRAEHGAKSISCPTRRRGKCHAKRRADTCNMCAGQQRRPDDIQRGHAALSGLHASCSFLLFLFFEHMYSRLLFHVPSISKRSQKVRRSCGHKYAFRHKKTAARMPLFSMLLSSPNRRGIRAHQQLLHRNACRTNILTRQRLATALIIVRAILPHQLPLMRRICFLIQHAKVDVQVRVGIIAAAPPNGCSAQKFGQISKQQPHCKHRAD